VLREDQACHVRAVLAGGVATALRTPRTCHPKMRFAQGGMRKIYRSIQNRDHNTRIATCFPPQLLNPG
jgi:hypothetical protein